MRRKGPVRIVERFEPCGACVGGWVLVWPSTERGFTSMPKAERCQCWTIHQAKIAQDNEAPAISDRVRGLAANARMR